ncbi:MAG: helix-turn-helix transcriptional regulator [Acidobacteriota bacterium]
MTLNGSELRILTIDCCEHILKTLSQLPNTRLLSRLSKDSDNFTKTAEVELIVIGLPRYPIRRLFVSQLRRAYPDIPILLLRREPVGPAELPECIRAEFLLSDRNSQADCELVQSVRQVMPFKTCRHISRGQDYDTVRSVIEVLSKNFSEQGLNLSSVALKLSISPKRLSKILNNHVGISFRELLRQVRIEEAKRMLRANQHSVKEVAARVGFADSHYFSKTFKEVTGQYASNYHERSAVLN